MVEEEKFNMAMRKFLKQVGVTSQREIEQAARAQGSGTLHVKMTLTADGTDLHHVVEGKINLD